MFLSVSVHNLLIVFFAILMLVLILIVVVLSYGLYQYKTLTNMLKWSLVIDQKLSETIVDSESQKPQDPLFDEYSKASSFRNLFLEKLVASKKKFSGSAQNEIKRLYINYDLEKESLSNLKQKQAYRIAGGIQGLTAMQMEQHLHLISGFLTHPSPQVYQEAQYAMLTFQGFKGLDFLDHFPYKISDWQQLRLLRSVNNIPSDCDESIRLWLSSDNTSVVIFTLRLLRKFQMLAFYDEVKTLLEHPAAQVRIQGVRTMQALENPSTREDFTGTYDAQPEEVQLEIIKAMKLSNDRQYAGFFKSQLLGHPAVSIQIAAAEALASLGNLDDLKRLAESESSSEHLVKIIRHALQEKIC